MLRSCQATRSSQPATPTRWVTRGLLAGGCLRTQELNLRTGDPARAGAQDAEQTRSEGGRGVPAFAAGQLLPADTLTDQHSDGEGRPS